MALVRRAASDSSVSMPLMGTVGDAHDLSKAAVSICMHASIPFLLHCAHNYVQVPAEGGACITLQMVFLSLQAILVHWIEHAAIFILPDS